MRSYTYIESETDKGKILAFSPALYINTVKMFTVIILQFKCKYSNCSILK